MRSRVTSWGWAAFSSARPQAISLFSKEWRFTPAIFLTDGGCVLYVKKIRTSPTHFEPESLMECGDGSSTRVHLPAHMHTSAASPAPAAPAAPELTLFSSRLLYCVPSPHLLLSSASHPESDGKSEMASTARSISAETVNAG